MKNPRFAYVCADPGIPIFGTKGSSIHVQEVIRGFLRVGAQVDLFATRLDGVAPPDLQAVKLHWLPALPKGDLAAREQASIGANRNLATALKREGPFDLVYERYSLWSFAGMEYARDAGVPGILEVNAPLIEEQLRYRELVDRSAAEEVAQRVFSCAEVVLAVSAEVAARLSTYELRRAPAVVANGVDPDRFPLGMPPSVPGVAKSFTVGFVGTLKPWHGLEVLVDAFGILQARASNVRLLIVGDGPEREEIAARIAARGLLSCTHFTGAVVRESIPGMLVSMDVGVAPYPPQDDFYFSPLKVYEYMAAALPVVASRIGQLSELIEDGRTGLLCEPGNAAELAAALDRLRRDPAFARALGLAAREEVLRNHTWDAVVDRILGLAGIAVKSPKADRRLELELELGTA